MKFRFFGRGDARPSAPSDTKASKTAPLLVPFGANQPQFTPRRSGALARSIGIERDGPRWRIGTNLAYGRFLEFGTRFMQAQPWLMPSVERLKPVFRRALRENL